MIIIAFHIVHLVPPQDRISLQVFDLPIRLCSGFIFQNLQTFNIIPMVFYFDLQEVMMTVILFVPLLAIVSWAFRHEIR